MPSNLAFYGKCFICHSKLIGSSKEISEEHRSAREHVIPFWLLNVSGFHRAKGNDRYRFSNGVFHTGHATVPCCRRCNDSLGILEMRTKEIFQLQHSLNLEERTIMYLWLLKIDYASTFLEYQKSISPRKDEHFGKMVSNKAYNRKKNFHGRVLKHFCMKRNLNGLTLSPFSLIHLEVENKELTFSKSPAHNRVVVSWNGKAFRLSLDDGREEQKLYELGEKNLSPELVERYFNNNDLLYSTSITYPELRRGRQKTVNPKPRRLIGGDQVLIIEAKKVSEIQFKIFGHILENGKICGEENSVVIVVNRTNRDEKMHLDEIEVHQPGLRKMVRTAAGTLDYSAELGIEKEILTPEREIMMLLFIVHESLKINFIINSTANLPVTVIP